MKKAFQHDLRGLTEEKHFQQMELFAREKQLPEEAWQFFLLRLQGRTLEEASVLLKRPPTEIETLRIKLERFIKEYQTEKLRSWKN